MQNELFERELQNTSINGISLADYVKENYAPIRKGHWIRETEGCYCSKCCHKVDEKSDFCPSCGADMRGVE